MTFNEIMYGSKSRMVHLLRLIAIFPLIVVFDATILIANCMYSAAEWWLDRTGSHGRYTFSVAWEVFNRKIRANERKDDEEAQ